MKYDGKTWETIVEVDTTRDCNLGPEAIYGITLDNQGGVWAWNSYGVQFLKDGRWITITSENSGLEYAIGLFGLVIDDSNRVWIGADKGVSMATIQNAQRPIPENIVQRHRAMSSLKERTNGMIWFIPAILALLWIATYLNVLPGVLLAVSLGLLSTLWLGPTRLDLGYGTSFINPGVVGTFCGVLGGIIGGLLDKNRSGRGSAHFGVILAIVGWSVGFCPLFVFIMIIPK